MLTDADLQTTLTAHHPHDMITDIGTHLGGAPVRLGECEQVGELMIKTPVSAHDDLNLGGAGIDGGSEGQFEVGLVLSDRVAVHDCPTLRRDLHGCGVDGVKITDETIRDPPGGQHCMQPAVGSDHDIRTRLDVDELLRRCSRHDQRSTLGCHGADSRTVARADPIEGTVRTGRSRSGRERCRRVGPRSAGAAQSTNRCCRASRSRRLPTPAARCSHRCRADVRRGSCNHHRG